MLLGFHLGFFSYLSENMCLSLCCCYIRRILLSFQGGVDSEGSGNLKSILDIEPLREMQMCFEC